MTYTPPAPPTVAVEVVVGTSATLIATVTGTGSVFNAGQVTLYIGGSSVSPGSYTAALAPGQQYQFPGAGVYYAVVAGLSGLASVAAFPAFGGGGASNLVNLVTQFGIDNTGTVNDNSTALTNALATLAAEGYYGFIPPQSNGSPGIVNVANTVYMGNGNQTTGASSTQGGGLIGAGYTGGNLIDGAMQTQGMAVLNWTAAAGGPLIEILGPLMGWRLENLCFDATIASGSQNTVYNKGGSGGVMRNCVFQQSTTSIMDDVSVSTFSGYCNTFWNEFDHITITTVPSGAASVVLGFSAVHSDVCFEWFHDIWFYMPGSNPAAQTIAIADYGSDTCRFERVFTGVTGANSIAYAVANFGSNYKSGGNTFLDCDFHATSSAKSVACLNGTIGTNGPMTFRNMGLANGSSVNPQIQGVIWECPESPLGFISGNTNIVFGTAYTNHLGVPVTIYATGGTITGVSINGVGGLTTTGPWRLPVNSSITFSGTGTLNTGILGD